MAYINVGASVWGNRPKSKAALRRAIAEEPGGVIFDATSSLSRGKSTYVPTPESIGTEKLSVTGPDPYTSRKWYATVFINSAGKVVVR